MRSFHAGCTFKNVILGTIIGTVVAIAILLGQGCATTPTKQNLYENLVACTKTQASQDVKNKALQCLAASTSTNYAACLEPLAVTWGVDEIECVAGYYEAATKSTDSGVK